MRESLKEEIQNAIHTRTSSGEWYINNIAQAACLVLWIEWTRSLDEALKSSDIKAALTSCLELYDGQLLEAVKMLGYPHDKIIYSKLNSVVSTLHAIKLTIEAMIESKIRTASDAIYVN